MDVMGAPPGGPDQVGFQRPVWFFLTNPEWNDGRGRMPWI
jgi:hypothetical protein